MSARFALTALALAVAPAAFAADAPARCAALKDSRIYQTEISQAQWLAAAPAGGDSGAALTGSADAKGTLVPHCVVEGEIEARTGVNGKHYGTRFQLRLPENWNGKFLFQGGGGLDGYIRPAIGSAPTRGSTAKPALQRGYAVVSTDSGHQGRDAAFAEDQQAKIDYAYAAVGKVTQVAKQLIRQNYQAQPKHSYFMGCSNGGRSALIAAQRYPTEFDGIVAGNPGFRLSRAALAEVWDNQQFMRAAPKNAQGERIFANALTQKDLDAVAQGVLNRCDAKDGIKDGIVNAWESCDFRPEMVQSSIGKDKVALLNRVFGGAKNSKGQAVYASWPYDPGIAAPAWRAWKLGDSQTAQPNARNIVLGMDSVPNYFSFPPFKNFDFMKFDFDRDTERTFQIRAINDADSTDFSTFHARGGKAVIFEGVADPVFSAHDQRDWYRQLQRDNNGKAADFARLFMVPGMNHCGEGPALDDFDPLTALENWREHGQVPESMTAKGKAFPNKSQPLCAYPKIAVYKGQGDSNDVENYVCKTL